MTTQQIEINGVKFDIDMRHAKRVETIAVGSKVKVLKKEYGGHKVYHGIVIGFEPFQKLPTIIIAYASIAYNDAKIEFVHYNTSSEDIEIVLSVDDSLDIDKGHFVNQVNRKIEELQGAIRDLEQKRQYFLDKFSSYWLQVEQAVADATCDIDNDIPF